MMARVGTVRACALWLVAVGFVMTAGTAASAATISWDLSGNAGHLDDGTPRSFVSTTSGGITVTATAWGYNGTFSTARLGQWSTGLGVCNDTEGAGCGSPQDNVDNAGENDWILFTFSQAVDISSFTVDPHGLFDADASFMTANLTAAQLSTLTSTLPGRSYSDLLGLGFGAIQNSDGNPNCTGNDCAPVSHAINGQFVNAILFGARADQSNDYFKISQIIASGRGVFVPEPATLALVATGLLGAAGLRRRRQRQ